MNVRYLVVVLRSSNGNDVTLDDVVVEDCQRGLVVGRPFNPPASGISVQVLNSRFIGNSLGILIQDGGAFLQDVVIRNGEASPRVSSTGILIGRGNLTMTRGKIIGQDNTGIQVIGSSSDTSLNVGGVLIARGRFDIDFGGLDNQLFMHDSIIRGQTEAAVRISALDSFINLGTASTPGNNTLSAASGFALDDTRRGTGIFERHILAAGTTLNGASFDGQTIDGPATLAPYYRVIDFDSGLQF